jgi:hypothetical protein
MMNLNTLFDALLLLSFIYFFYFEDFILNWAVMCTVYDWGRYSSYIWVGGAPENKGRT